MQYLYLSGKNTLNQMRNIWIIFKTEKFPLFKNTYNVAILFIWPLKFDETEISIIKNYYRPSILNRLTSISKHDKS